MVNAIKIIGIILQLPLILLGVASFGVSIYLVITKLYPITLATPIIMGIILLMYFIGLFLVHKNFSKKK